MYSLQGDIFVENLKDEVLRSIHEMPDIQCIEDVMYRLYVLDKIRKGKACVEQGNLYSESALLQEIETW